MNATHERPAELYLALRDGDAVRCTRCGRPVDFEKSCELIRPGHHLPLQVSRCHTCLVERAPSHQVTMDAWHIAGELVNVFGKEGAKEAIAASLLLPAVGSSWVFCDPAAPDVRFQFEFVRHVGDMLQFSGPCGPWLCRREDWTHHVAFQRVVPFRQVART